MNILSFRVLNNITGWLVWLVATITYVLTIEPTASFWDCGEYIACSYKLEVGHPPGAPFFILIGRLFTLLAPGPDKAAMMVNIMSALCSSFTILFLFWTITRLALKWLGTNFDNISSPQRWLVLMSSAVGALAYTYSDSFWFSAVEGEVYAMSSFFTAVVFWAILKWDEEDDQDPASALRWIVFIVFLIGVSIGVHLLNLLVIPAIGYVIYFKKYKFSNKGFVIAGVVSILILGGIQNIIIPKIVKFVSDYEVFFTNKWGLPFNTGTVVFFLLIIASITLYILYTIKGEEKWYKFALYTSIAFTAFAIFSAPSGSAMLLRLMTLSGMIYAIHYFKKKTELLNLIFVSLATLLIGYSAFFVLVIRSQSNPPMDENDPENAPSMLSYLLREQYGDWPLLYGPYYNAPTKSSREFKSGDPIYIRDEASKKYVVADDRKNSIPTYEEEFCTIYPRMRSSQSHHEAAYRYWGNVAEYHKKKILENPQTGEPETVEVPTFRANLTFFFKYQVWYMYWRYFMWNFSGRQNDVQGLLNNPFEGNWITGIKFVDDFLLGEDSTKIIHRDKNNFARNKFYMLPFLLGLFGAIRHFRRRFNDAWVVLVFFFMTGLAIVIYLNQTPYQPRERDYSYAGSFYAFSIWIGLGVIALHEWLKNVIKNEKTAMVIPVFCFFVPYIMAAEGWNDHDRSLRTLARDTAINYLESCAPNAILFTNGDNDTFPLWYAQEVEGIRTDVRVVNLSLLQTDWYINQMRRKAYESDPVPFTIPPDKYLATKREVIYLIEEDDKQKPMSLKKGLEFALSDDPANKIDNGTKPIDYIKARTFYVPVDSMAVMKNKVISVKDTHRLVKTMTFRIPKGYITKNDLMVLDLVAHNDWKRPIYFAVTTGSEAYIGLEKYFQLEGLAYRLVPIEQSPLEQSMGGRVNTEVMYKNIMEKFRWGGIDKKGINLDENCVRLVGNLRMQMGVLAHALINEGKSKKAEAVLDKCLEVMPDENIPFDATMFSICSAYYQIGKIEKANALSKKLFDIFEGDLKIYRGLKPRHSPAFYRDMEQAKEILKRLHMLAKDFKQKNLEKEYWQRLQAILSPEELTESLEDTP
ncbi:MAG: DUF2723 domain-containing protein [Bacteroidia bacterium]|nr:DUF2723 domain-containing protein [Bacteroidia bacterium]